MPKTLKGSCHCGAVRFSVQSHTPVPFRFCLCSICRKFGSLGGNADVLAIRDTLQVEGKEHTSMYNPIMNRDTPDEYIAKSEWYFCSKCSSGLWLDYPDRLGTVYIVAAAIDTPLPTPPEFSCIWVDSKPECSPLPQGTNKVYHDNEPLPTVEDWHKEHGLYVE